MHLYIERKYIFLVSWIASIKERFRFTFIMLIGLLECLMLDFGILGAIKSIIRNNRKIPFWIFRHQENFQFLLKCSVRHELSSRVFVFSQNISWHHSNLTQGKFVIFKFHLKCSVFHGLSSRVFVFSQNRLWHHFSGKLDIRKVFVRPAYEVPKSKLVLVGPRHHPSQPTNN